MWEERGSTKCGTLRISGFDPNIIILYMKQNFKHIMDHGDGVSGEGSQWGVIGIFFEGYTLIDRTKYNMIYASGTDDPWFSWHKILICMIAVQNDSTGLFRASRSHNPAQYSQSVGPLPHYLLILGRAIKPLPHQQASLSWGRAFCTGIIHLL